MRPCRDVLEISFWVEGTSKASGYFQLPQPSTVMKKRAVIATCVMVRGLKAMHC